MAGQLELKGDILHPRAALHWRNCHKPLWDSHYFPRSCAILHDKVAILTSGYHILTSGYHALRDVLHISSTTSLDSWAPVTLPNQFMSLATYQSKFVAVGGRDHLSYKPTNVCTSISGLEWEPTLPPMPTKRYMTSSVSARSPEALVVAGGKDSQHKRMKVIEVLQGDKWTSVDLLPYPDCGMLSIFHDGKIFFMRNKKTNGTAYYCNFSSLISLNTSSSEDTEPLWEHLQTPGEKTTVGAIVSFSSKVVSINGNAIVRAYSNSEMSWVKATSVGKKSKRHGYRIAASSFSTREIVFIHRRGGVYLLQLSISPFSLWSDFTPNILTRLEASGVEVANLLEESHSTQSSSLNLQELEKVLLHWYDGLIGHRPPCWRYLLEGLKKVGLEKLFRIIYDLLQVQVEIVQDQIEKNRESENLKYYLSQIPEQFHKNLDEEIDDNILCKSAESLAGWRYKYDLLDLNDSEMKRIEQDNDSAELQRKAALTLWKKKLGLLSTYRNLLVICIRGNWQDSAKDIVTFISRHMGLHLSKPFVVSIIFVGNFPTDTEEKAPRILTHPTPVTCNRGDTVEFTCVSDNASHYVWLRNKRRMKGSFGQKLTLTNVSPEEVALYSCRVVNAAGTVTSSEARLCLITDIEINQEPEAKQLLRICEGEQYLHLTCQAQSTSGSQLNYEWQQINHKGNPIAIVGNSSEVNVTVVHKELNVRPVLMYRCKIIDSTDSKSYTYSRPVVVKIETVWITQELKDVSAKVNTPTTLRCDGKGYSYCMWSKSSTGYKETMTLFRETKLPILHFPKLSADNGGYYECNLYHKQSQYHVTTRTAHLKPFITEGFKLLKVLWQPYSCTVRRNSTFRLIFEVYCFTSDVVTHQWYLNGQKLNGDTNQDLKRENVDQMQCGSYHCEAKVGEETITSDKAVVNLAWQESQPSDSKKYRFVTGEKLGSTSTYAHSKVALLIGNQNYEHLRRLQSSENDITALAKVLRERNFQVFALVDLNFSEMQAALTMFYRSLVCNTYALFYFCGHGFNDGTQTSCMIPVDYPSETDPTMGFHMSKIITSMQEKKCNPLCIVDACRLAVHEMQPQLDDNIKDTSNFLCICSIGEKSSAVDISANDSDSKPVSPFNKALRKAIESGCKITELPGRIMEDYEGIFVHGQFRDAISLQDEISVSMDEGDELVEDLRENGKRYKNCISVPEAEWVPINKNSELALKFSSMLTNVWQLKVLPILIDYSDTTSVQVEFDKPYLESQGVSLVELDKNLESQGVSLNLLGYRGVELRGVQKLVGPLKILMEVKVDGNSIGKCVYKSSDVPSIARHMQVLKL